MVYAIYEDFYPDVEKKLNRIAKKCAKHGNEFVFEIKGNEIREEFNKELCRKEYHKFILVEVEGTAKIDNWECIAVLEINKNGNIIRRINTEIDIPEHFRVSDNVCEHCNAKRHRNNLYVIHNVITNEWKQVGGNCLSLYTHGLNMNYVTAYMDGITELEEYNGVFNVNGGQYYSVKEVISCAVEIISKTGYFNAQSFLPTKTLVTHLMCSPVDLAVKEINRDLENAKLMTHFKNNDFYKDDTVDTVNKIIEYYKNVKDDSEFIHNIHVMLNEEYVQLKNFGFLCYLPEGYAKHVQKEVERVKRENAVANSEYFGNIGSRYKNEAIECVNLIASWETQFGVTHVYKIILKSGEALIWKTSNGLYLESNEKFDKISFTIKSHNEYRGEKQTEVTRCKITYAHA